jgi:hypothetical protein
VDVLPNGAVEVNEDQYSQAGARAVAQHALYHLDAPLTTWAEVATLTQAAVEQQAAYERKAAEEKAAKDAADAVESERQITEALTKLDANVGEYLDYQDCIDWRKLGIYASSMQAANAHITPALRIAIRNEVDRRVAERAEQKAKYEAQKTEDARLSDAKEQAKEKQVAEWVGAKGTASQQERLKAGVLPRQEILDAIKAEAFAPADQKPGVFEYEPVTRENLHADIELYDDHGHGVACEYNALTELTAVQFETYTAIKAALPGATLELRTHHCTCKDSDCNAEMDRDSVKAVLTVGALTFTKEYKL